MQGTYCNPKVLPTVQYLTEKRKQKHILLKICWIVGDILWSIAQYITHKACFYIFLPVC